MKYIGQLYDEVNKNIYKIYKIIKLLNLKNLIYLK